MSDRAGPPSWPLEQVPSSPPNGSLHRAVRSAIDPVGQLPSSAAGPTALSGVLERAGDPIDAEQDRAQERIDLAGIAESFEQFDLDE